MQTFLVDARTGRSRIVSIDASFGCRTQSTPTNATRTQPVYEVRWSRVRRGERDQSRKFTTRDGASDWFKGRHMRRMNPEFIVHVSGMHDVAC